MNSLRKAALLLLIFFSMGFLLLVVLGVDGVASARLAIDEVSGSLLVFRLIVVAIVWWFWNPMVEWLFSDNRHTARSEANIAAYKAQRTNFLLGFLAIEIFVVQNVIGAVLSGVL